MEPRLRLCCACSLLLTIAATAGCGSTLTPPVDTGTGGDVWVDQSPPVDVDTGVVVLPDGTVVVPDAGMLDTTVVYPDGGRPDTTVVFPDGGRLDMGTGLDSGVAHVGTPCRTAEDCPGLFCSTPSTGFGYCSWVCSESSPCPEDAVCAVFRGSTIGYCMQRCDPRSPMCAMGYLCQPGLADAPVCYPGCTTAADCPAGQRCGDGSGGLRQCYTPGAAVGAPCSSTGECPATGYCLDEADWGAPHGTCVTFCNLTTRTGCTADATCVAWGYGGAGSCVPICDDTHPCRAGYTCVPAGADSPHACVPRCTSDDDCTGGRACSFVTGRCGA